MLFHDLTLEVLSTSLGQNGYVFGLGIQLQLWRNSFFCQLEILYCLTRKGDFKCRCYMVTSTVCTKNSGSIKRSPNSCFVSSISSSVIGPMSSSTGRETPWRTLLCDFRRIDSHTGSYRRTLSSSLGASILNSCKKPRLGRHLSSAKNRVLFPSGC